jgi:ATP-binding cassette subfamily B protein
LVRNPEILILDEATSALDPGTEAAINATLRKVGEHCTVVSATHRLAPVAGMDHIFVMEKGRLVEHGRHAELLKLRGAYYQLWHKQSGFVVSDDGHAGEVAAARLKEMPLLSHLDLGYLQEIANRFVTEVFTDGELVLAQGEIGTKFYIIIRGAVDVVTADEAGGSHHMAVLEVGDYFGEIALLANVAVTATVRARMATTCLSLAREQFHHLLNEVPGIRTAIEPVMAKRLRETAAAQHFGSLSARAV